MNDADRDRIVRDYISQAMEIQNGKHDEIPDLKDIARELGMTDEEIAGVERAAAEHLERGEGYLRHRQWEDAIGELTVATALNPASIDAIYALASAYAGRWGQTRHKDDRAEAERLIKRCIDLKADHEASYTLLEQLNRGGSAARTPTWAGADLTTPAGSQQATKRAVVVIISVVVAIAGLVGGIIAFVGTSDSSSSKTSAKGRPIPISLAAGSDMRLDLDDSRLYPGEGVCCVKGDVTPNVAKAGLAGVALELDLIDSSGNVASSDRFTAWPCDKHPGSFNFHRDNPIVPGIREARLVLQQ
jgi:hypothetical protein